MKSLSIITTLILAFAALSRAGTTEVVDGKTGASALTGFGTGFFVAPEGGANVVQDVPVALGTGSHTIDSSHTNTGGFAGAKLGYVFNFGLLRPDIESDMFYNTFGGTSGSVFTNSLGRRREDYKNYQVHTGAFMTNGILRFNFGRFQPYAGAGIGLYTGSVTRQYITTSYSSGQTLSYTHANNRPTAWAWQIVAGADYYLRPKVSVFAEYKFLNYMTIFSPASPQGGRCGQQLVGGGIRYHF